MSRQARRTSLVLVLVLVTAALAGDAVADHYSLFSYWQANALEHGNSNKIVIGRSSSLHAVYRSLGAIYYSTSEDGESWLPELKLGIGSQPAIAVDDQGTVGVVWVGEWFSNDMGKLFYAYKPLNSPSWTVGRLNADGAEPSLVASGDSMYLAWTTVRSIRYGKFRSASPPATLAGEPVEQTACAATGFRRPAVALTRDPCGAPIARVGFLLQSDEQGSPFPCYSAATRVGPRVSQRDNATSTWANIYDSTRTSTLTTSSVSAGSLSMDTHFWSGNLFLSWSDVQDGAPRTKLAHQGSGWVTTDFGFLLENKLVHVHIRSAGPNRPPTEFRVAWTVSGGGNDPFHNGSSRRAVGSWVSSTPNLGPAIALAATGISVGRPQSLRHVRCVAGEYFTTDAIFEASSPTLSPEIATDFKISNGCPIELAYPLQPCRRPGPASM